MPSSPVIRSDDVDALGFPWGVIKWLMNDETGADAQQTFGIVYISAGQQNPPHYHPNCEELLYVLYGACEHTLGDQSYRMGPGRPDPGAGRCGSPGRQHRLGAPPRRHLILLGRS